MKRCLRCERRFDGDGWACHACGFGPKGGPIPIFAPELAAHGGEDYPTDVYEGWRSYELNLGWWFRPRARLIAWALGRYFPGVGSFFDAGCGAGSVLGAVREADPAIALFGADASPRALELTRGRVRDVSVIQADATRLPFRGEFDAVGTFDVLEHLEDDAAALAELVATVRPGGGLLVTVPQHPWLWSAEDEAGGHKRRYRRRDLLALVRGTGLEPVRVTSYVFSLLPLMAAVRRRRRRHSPDRALELARHQPPGAAFMERVLSAEVAAVRRGVSWPIGGSLLLVARRPSEREGR